MSILEVKNLSHGFGDRAIFEDVSFRLLKGEHIGLVGANGEGKSTFMSIVTGKMLPDEGKVEWSKYVTAGYLDQHSVLAERQSVRDVLRTAFDELFKAEARINDLYMKMAEDGADVDALMEEVGELQDRLESRDFYTLDAKIDEVARALGVMDFGMDTDVTSLSGGQRTKVLLAKLLLEKPDILLLDEPTNYLDAEHIDWLKRYLQNYENAFVLISHDIPFLNDVINIVYHVENQQLTRYSGDYYQFQEVYAMKKSQLEAAYERQQKEIADLKDFVARNKARVATRNMAMSRQKKLDKMDIIELQSEKPKPSFDFKPARTPGRFIFQAKNLQIGYDRPLTKPLNLTFERNQKVAIIGANGIGKTTLLKSLLGIISPIAGEVERGDYLELGYFEQEVEGGNRQTPLEAVWNAFPALNQAEVRAALARCGLTTKHIESQIQVLSGGEQAKVRFCLLMNRENNVLVLDEPTNHLDVDAKDELKRALKEYRGSILMVCHEPDFYEGWIDQIWDFNNLTLDEPTNHLDVDAKDELKRALKEYRGSILMVCHEPDFYEGWIDQIWDFNNLT
ncbi:ABC transporter ATP-binding protein [Streptococcus pneumoniae]|nr:ABC transporter ATP-binding protein [Streptococcus pneumoniae]